MKYQRNTRKQSKDHAYARVRRASYDFLNNQNPKKNIWDGVEDGEDDWTDERDALLLSKILCKVTRSHLENLRTHIVVQEGDMDRQQDNSRGPRRVARTACLDIRAKRESCSWWSD